MKIYLPTDNPQSRGYSSSHKAYDFRGAGLPDAVRCGADGEIIERVDIFTANWINTGKLTTRDYGNYIKVRHTDNSYPLLKGTCAIYAHLKKGSALAIGAKVQVGQIIARIGNTGNSTGPHLHAEFRNSLNINTEVEFYTVIEVPQPETELIKTKDLIDLRRKEDAYNIVCDFLKLPTASTTGVQIVEEIKKKR